MGAKGFSTGAKDPWCPGCGHIGVVRSLQKALERRFDPQDVVLVTDIGCIGMADGLFSCHTVHGLHGRAPALASGISMTKNGPTTKVVGLVGDGGASIGLQHILECARLNVDLTIVVCNNQVYGMTGGQHSPYTVQGIKTTTTPEGSSQSPFPLCEMLAPLGIKRARILATDRGLTDVLSDALDHRGFALVETMNYCPSHAGKRNPDELNPRAMKTFFPSKGLAFGKWSMTTRSTPFEFASEPKPMELETIERRFDHGLAGKLRILLAGSAGLGVQKAAEVFARAAISSGLHAVVDGEYPVTVSKGFSASFLVLSPDPIVCSSTEAWDVGLATSAEGLSYALDHLSRIRRLVIDTSLETAAVEPQDLPRTARPRVKLFRVGPVETWSRTETVPFPSRTEDEADAPVLHEKAEFRRHGSRQAAFSALAWLREQERCFPVEALRDAVMTLPGTARESLLQVLQGDHLV